ncbi:response regulator transcription factor (plasmid) [Deinococcus radiomollis]|uniref:response regulator transcription factor n=1 Tax=Deinococcus radiomollis TaxID=468916 RepID=UPI0038915EFE
MPYVLIIEDDPDIAAVLQHDLQSVGYRTSHADSVTQGLTCIREHAPDLILLDLNLPDGNGRDILIRLKRTTDIRVMVLTAHDAIHEKVELLNLGANDYVVKPYDFDELLARVAVQLRILPTDAITVRDLELSPSKRLATHKGRELKLAPKEFDILAFLMTNPGKVHSRADIHEAIWGKNTHNSDSFIDVHLANIRGKLRDAGLYGYLRTVRGFGYALKS